MRVKIKFPDQSPLAAIPVRVRIGDVNYGGHVGHDSILSVIHESRMQWLAGAGMTELNAGGHGLIVADVIIVYRGEAFYGDLLTIELFAADVTDRSFDILYRITTERDGLRIVIAEAKTGIVCFDYPERKIAWMSEALRLLLAG